MCQLIAIANFSLYYFKQKPQPKKKKINVFSTLRDGLRFEITNEVIKNKHHQSKPYLPG